MSEQSELHDFSGIVRLFPLPDLVFYPHAVQPLHIFEPRYRQMTADALAGDRLITMVLLCDGWEAQYQGRPPIHKIGCLGRIGASRQLADGRYHLVLHGLHRLRILDEQASDSLYRVAGAEILTDDRELSQAAASRLLKKLIDGLATWFTASSEVIEEARSLVESDLAPSAFCDLLAFKLPLPVSVKQELLEQLDVEERIGRLVEHLYTHPPAKAQSGPQTPLPKFSDN
jgi:Lon protease-like protein